MTILNWRDWFTKTIVKERIVVKYDPYYFTSSAQEYRDEISHLKRLLKQAEDAQKAAESAAKKKIFPTEEMIKGIKAVRLLTRLKQELEWIEN
jgi:hypothetical protein